MEIILCEQGQAELRYEWVSGTVTATPGKLGWSYVGQAEVECVPVLGKEEHKVSVDASQFMCDPITLVCVIGYFVVIVMGEDEEEEGVN